MRAQPDRGDSDTPASRIHALLPAIHGRPTGGNVYNDALLSALAARTSVTLHHEHALDFELLSATTKPGDVLLVDSLLLDAYKEGQQEGGLRARNAILVVHYLQLLDPGKRSGARADEEREALASFAGCVTTSGFARRALLNEGIPPDRVLALKPGIDGRFRPSGRVRPAMPPRLLSVASLLPGKGLLDLLGQLESLEDLDWRWEIAGDDRLEPGYAAHVRGAFARSPCADRIDLLGPLPPKRLAERYREADLLLHGSEFETCGMVVMEALASGLPVAAFRVGGLPEQVRAAGSVVLVEPDRPEALQAVLRGLLASPEQWIAMRRAALSGRPYPTWDSRAALLMHWLEAAFG